MTWISDPVFLTRCNASPSIQVDFEQNLFFIFLFSFNVYDRPNCAAVKLNDGRVSTTVIANTQNSF